MTYLAILRDRKIRGTLLAIAIPIALQNLITYMTSMMDTMMLGQLGEVELSGAALANQFATIFMVLTFGIASGTNVLLSQYWGKKDVASIRSILAIMYRVTLVLSIIFFLAARFFPQAILSVFSNDPEVIAVGTRYLRLVCYSYGLNGMTNVMLMTLRAVGTVKISIVVYLTSLVANTFLNWVLIFGKLGFPALGMEGGAIATIIARAIEFAIAFVYIFWFEKKIHMTFRRVVLYDHSFLRDYGVNVSPVLLNELIWSLGNSMLLVVMGQMGRGFVSANSIANVTTQFTQVFIIGLSNATSVLIGNSIGAEQYDTTRDLAKSIMVVGAVFGVLAGGTMLLLRPIIVNLYNIPDSTKLLAMEIMAVAALITVFQSLTFTGLMGVLRGGGDTRFVIFCDVTFLWLFSIPAGLVTGLWLGWAPPVVYFILKSDEILKLLVGLPRIWGGKWVRNVTRP